MLWGQIRQATFLVLPALILTATCPLHKVAVAFLLGDKEHCTLPGAAAPLHVHLNCVSSQRPHLGDGEVGSGVCGGGRWCGGWSGDGGGRVTRWLGDRHRLLVSLSVTAETKTSLQRDAECVRTCPRQKDGSEVETGYSIIQFVQ